MATGEFWRSDVHGALRRMFNQLPAAPSYSPNSDALEKSKGLGDDSVTAAIQRFISMPQSTGILANPPLHEVPVECNGTPVTLKVRSFGIRGVLSESDIVAGRATPADVIFIGLFARKPEKDPIDESAVLAAYLDRKFRQAIGLKGEQGVSQLVDRVARFVIEHPGLGPELTMQHIATLRKADRSGKQVGERAMNDDRKSGALLLQLMRTHMENVAAGGLSIYCNKLRRENSGIEADELARRANEFLEREVEAGKSAFQIAYSLLLGRSANDNENAILERMGVIQTHHGSAGSNVVARYLATLHCLSISDFFTAAQMVMDGERHFGAIHDMTAFIEKLEKLAPEQRDDAIRQGVLTGGLPTFGHPEIAAAGRGATIQQDPRAAIYLAPLFEALDSGKLQLNEKQKTRLAIVQRIYRIAFVDGVIKPGREDKPPLRLTPNTDFGAWSVQEALGIFGASRTYLTYVFRGFGWMMDAREQLQQKIIRPVIAPDPAIIPTDKTDPTIPEVVVALHKRLAENDDAFAQLG